MAAHFYSRCRVWVLSTQIANFYLPIDSVAAVTPHCLLEIIFVLFELQYINNIVQYYSGCFSKYYINSCIVFGSLKKRVIKYCKGLRNLTGSECNVIIKYNMILCLLTQNSIYRNAQKLLLSSKFPFYVHKNWSFWF